MDKLSSKKPLNLPAIALMLVSVLAIAWSGWFCISVGVEFLKWEEVSFGRYVTNALIVLAFMSTVLTVGGIVFWCARRWKNGVFKQSDFRAFLLVPIQQALSIAYMFWYFYVY